MEVSGLHAQTGVCLVGESGWRLLAFLVMHTYQYQNEDLCNPEVSCWQVSLED